MQPCAHVAMSHHMLCLIPPPCSPYPKGPGMDTAHGDTVFGVTVTSDGRSAVSAGMGFIGTDNTLRVWDLASGQCKKTLQVGGACMGPTGPPEYGCTILHLHFDSDPLDPAWAELVFLRRCIAGRAAGHQRQLCLKSAAGVGPGERGVQRKVRGKSHRMISRERGVQRKVILCLPFL